MTDKAKLPGTDNTVFDLTRVISLALADTDKRRNAVTFMTESDVSCTHSGSSYYLVRSPFRLRWRNIEPYN